MSNLNIVYSVVTLEAPEIIIVTGINVVGKRNETKVRP